MRKFLAVVAINWQDTLAYGSTSIIWILADALLALLMPAVWLSAYEGRAEIFGFTPAQLVTYYLATLVMAQFVVCHLLWDIGYEIREGMFTAQLLRPFSVFWMNAARNIAWRVIKTIMFAPFAVLYLIAYQGYLDVSIIHIGFPFLIALILAHVLSYMMAFTIAMIAIWTTEYYSIFALYYFPETFFSGRFFPLAALPFWILAIGDWLPFKYTISFPAEILLGKLDTDSLLKGFAFQIGWIAVFGILGAILFRAGCKRYTGFGN